MATEVLVLAVIGLVLVVLVIAEAYALSQFLQTKFVQKQQILLIEKTRKGVTIVPIQQIQGVVKK